MSKVFESSVKMHRDWGKWMETILLLVIKFNYPLGSRLQKYWHVEGSNVVTIVSISTLAPSEDSGYVCCPVGSYSKELLPRPGPT